MESEDLAALTVELKDLKARFNMLAEDNNEVVVDNYGSGKMKLPSLMLN